MGAVTIENVGILTQGSVGIDSLVHPASGGIHFSALEVPAFSSLGMQPSFDHKLSTSMEKGAPQCR